MEIYPEETAQKYAEIRKSITCTENAAFAVLRRIGIRDKEILDFGCGDGTYALKFAKLGAKSVMGIDISPAMIELAEKNARSVSNVEFQIADGRELPYKENQFDIAFANFVLQHFPRAIEPIREIYRVLKSDGHFVGVFPATHFKKGFEHLFNTELPIKLGGKVTVQTLAKNAEEIQNDLKDTGFQVAQYQEVENPDASIDDSYSNRDSIEAYKAIVFDAVKPS